MPNNLYEYASHWHQVVLLLYSSKAGLSIIKHGNFNPLWIEFYFNGQSQLNETA